MVFVIFYSPKPEVSSNVGIKGYVLMFVNKLHLWNNSIQTQNRLPILRAGDSAYDESIKNL